MYNGLEMQGLACNILCYGNVTMGFEERANVTFITINIISCYSKHKFQPVLL